ncbi:hypothetical protein HPB51_016592 [Rhipicephalus microplus]|uniref:Uncharacterized protein n=1 Tax=Rhipicephalus microplus TaxID=6941 RepID=A0A9J6E2P5_RHIMP|nr:hypothetical protein HPB51_016592 [Rhipicephalus microplus]
MEIVEGEEISQDEANSPCWMTAYGRKNSKGMRMATTTCERTPTRGGRKGGGCTTAPRNVYQRIVATSRFPQLLRDKYRIIEKNACTYVKAQQVRLGDCTYKVSVYPAPLDDTCKGVIRGVDVDVNKAELRAGIVNHRNAGTIEVKRIKSNMAVVVLEIASLKVKLRKQKAAQAISSRVVGVSMAENAVHKSTQEPKVDVSKAKRKAPPPKDDSDSEMPGVESSQNKMLEELLRISKKIS